MASQVMAKCWLKIHRQIVEAFAKIGVGEPVTIPQLRRQLGLQEFQQDALTRRVRQLRDFGYKVPYSHKTKAYSLRSLTPDTHRSDTEPISGRLSAEVLYAAHGKCQMCGKNIEEDSIKLVVDHRVPRSWGGKTVRENLWALCERCNISKQAFFATIDDDLLRRCLKFDEPIRALAELLVGYHGQPVPRRLLELVGQDEQWTRRLRELRELGWKVPLVRVRGEERRYTYTYRAARHLALPADIPAALREHRMKNKKRAGGKGDQSKES